MGWFAYGIAVALLGMFAFAVIGVFFGVASVIYFASRFRRRNSTELGRYMLAMGPVAVLVGVFAADLPSVSALIQEHLAWLGPTDQRTGLQSLINVAMLVALPFAFLYAMVGLSELSDVLTPENVGELYVLGPLVGSILCWFYLGFFPSALNQVGIELIG